MSSRFKMLIKETIKVLGFLILRYCSPNLCKEHDDVVLFFFFFSSSNVYEYSFYPNVNKLLA